MTRSVVERLAAVSGCDLPLRPAPESTFRNVRWETLSPAQALIVRMFGDVLHELTVGYETALAEMRRQSAEARRQRHRHG